MAIYSPFSPTWTARFGSLFRVPGRSTIWVEKGASRGSVRSRNSSLGFLRLLRHPKAHLGWSVQDRFESQLGRYRPGSISRGEALKKAIGPIGRNRDLFGGRYKTDSKASLADIGREA